jgi:hypothetical protein
VSSQVLQKFMLSVDINTIHSIIITDSFVYSVDFNINHIHCRIITDSFVCSVGVNINNIHSRIMPAFSYFTCKVRFFCDLSSQKLIRE